MMRFLFILGLMLSSVPLFAQQENSVPNQEKELLTSKLRKKIKSITSIKSDTLKPALVDSLTQKGKSSLDKVQSVKDSLKVPSLQDSLSSLVKSPFDSLGQKGNRVKAVLQERTDSIKSFAGGVTSKIEGVENKVQSKIDVPQQKINQVEEKLNENITKAENKIGDIENKATSEITDAKSKIENQVSKITGEKKNLPDVQGKLDIPKVELPKETLPSLKTDIPDIKLDQPNLNLNLDPSLKSNLPGIEGVDVPNLGDKVKLPNIDKPSIDGLDKVGEVSDQLKGVDQKLEVAEGYEKELQKIKEGDLKELEKLPGEAEKRVGQLEQVKGLSTEINKATAQQAQYEAMIKKYQDKKLLQEEMVRKFANVANDELAKHAAQVQQAQNKLSKAKHGIGQIKSVKDIFKVKSDELEGKKFHQRLIPGFTTQVYNKDYFRMDIGLQIGYRFMPKITAGVGATYRVGVDKKFEYYINNEEVYGGRVYLDFAIKKGIFLHGEFEALKYTVQPAVIAPTIITEYSPNAVYGSYFGLGKRFNVSRQVRANVIALYRVEYEGKLPSMSKFNIRMGFDYMFGNKKRKFTMLKR